MDVQIAALIQELGSDDAETRNRAVQALECLGAPAVLPLIDALQNDHWRIRGKAAWTLGEIRDARAVMPLLETLKDSHEIVRWSAARALAKIPIGHDLTPLLNALHDSDEHVRLSATRLLGHTRDARAVAPLMEVLRTGDAIFARWSAMQALIRIGPPAVELLLQLSCDGDPFVRKSAIEILGEIGDVRAVEALLETAHDPDYFVRQTAMQALCTLCGQEGFLALPQQVLITTHLSVRKRIAILEALRRVHLQDDPQFPLYYFLPTVPKFCEALLDDENPAVRTEAYAVLEYYTLMRSSQRDASADTTNLLRPLPGVKPTEEAPETLLRPPYDTLEAPPPKKPGLLQRLFRR